MMIPDVTPTVPSDSIVNSETVSPSENSSPSETPPPVAHDAGVPETPVVAEPADPKTEENGRNESHPHPEYDYGRIAQNLQIRKGQVESVAQLLESGNSVSFISTYRRDKTGGLTEEIVRQIHKHLAQQKHHIDRKATIVRSLTVQNKLTDELKAAIARCENPKRLEDLYLPYKPKKKSQANVAKEKGLGALAEAIWTKDTLASNLAELLPTMLNPEKGLNTPDDIMAGVKDILAENISESPDVRESVRRFVMEHGKFNVTKAENVGEDKTRDFKDYLNYSEQVRQVPPQRMSAILRGEKEKVLQGKLVVDANALAPLVQEKLPLADHPHAELITSVIPVSVEKLLIPSMEKEIRRDLTEKAEEHTLHVFARNLRRLLLQPPVPGRRICSIDPAYRNGCKVAALDETGHYLGHTTIYPFGPAPQKPDKKKETKAEAEQANKEVQVKVEEETPATSESAVVSDTPVENSQEAVAEAAPAVEATTETVPETAPTQIEPNHKDEARQKLAEFVKKHQLNTIVIGNGTASRETEELVSEMINEQGSNLEYIVISEAGASQYASGSVAREELPRVETAARGAVSIGRRLMDPLSELVKIDPQHLGVGSHHHDVPEKKVRESLEGVIEACVNQVGVNLNTASVSLLKFVSGLNPLRATSIVEHRQKHGAFKNREELKQVTGINDVVFSQAAAFVRVLDGDQPLDRSPVHPENYPHAVKLLEKVDATPASLCDPSTASDVHRKLRELPLEDISKELDMSLPASRDFIEMICQTGHDVRTEVAAPIFKKSGIKFDELTVGMELRGTVQNVVDFGAFVDVGLKDAGLVHISQLANKFIKSPHDIVALGDVVSVWIMSLDMDKKRVSLTMIPPGTERSKPPVRGERPFRREGGPRREGGGPPRRRFDGPPREGVAEGQPVEGASASGDDRPRRFDNRGPRPEGGGRFGGGNRFGGQRGDGGNRPGRFGGPPPGRFRGQPHRGSETTAGGASNEPQPQRASSPKRKEKPKPKLTQEAIQGKTPLRTFGELKALFETKNEPEAPAPTPTSQVEQTS